jgi:hypothetical protein
MSQREKRRLKIDELRPTSRGVRQPEKDTVVKIPGRAHPDAFPRGQRRNGRVHLDGSALGDRAVPGQVLKPHPRPSATPSPVGEGAGGNGANGGREKSRPFSFPEWAAGSGRRTCGTPSPLGEGAGGQVSAAGRPAGGTRPTGRWRAAAASRLPSRAPGSVSGGPAPSRRPRPSASAWRRRSSTKVKSGGRRSSESLLSSRSPQIRFLEDRLREVGVAEISALRDARKSPLRWPARTESASKRFAF